MSKRVLILRSSLNTLLFLFVVIKNFYVYDNEVFFIGQKKFAKDTHKRALLGVQAELSFGVFKAKTRARGLAVNKPGQYNDPRFGL